MDDIEFSFRIFLREQKPEYWNVDPDPFLKDESGNFVNKTVQSLWKFFYAGYVLATQDES